MKHTRVLLAAFLSAALLCMSALAFTPETVEAGAEPVIENREATLNEVTSNLLFYQDFDNLPTGSYQSGEIASMLSESAGNKLVDFGKQGWGVLGSGCTFEICEEENGNRYLKITGATYRAFGVWFENDSMNYAVMSYNYKYPSAGTCKSVNTAAYSAKGTAFVGGNSNGNTGNWAASGAITDTSKTDWTQARAHTYIQSPCLGFGFNQTDGESVIYLDDLAVWSFSTKIDDPTEPAHKSAVKKTISFQNSSDFSGYDVSMPSDIERCVWYNFYNGQWYVPVTVDLNNIIPSSAPNGYEFAGWSTSDGGTRVKDCHYADFKVPGNFTFYALWKKAAPTVMFENFESYEAGTVLTSDDLAFLQLNQFGSADFTATVVLDETTGSKVLKIAGSNIYAGFALKNRGRAAEKEYVMFDYRFDSAEGSRLTLYAGTDHTGGNHRGTVGRTTVWTSYIFGSDPANNVFGFFFDRDSGNYVIYLDNVYYWCIPKGVADEDKAVTVSFADTTVGIKPEGAVMPEAITKQLWEDKDTVNNTVNLAEIVPTSIPGGYRFVGWSLTDGGKVIATKYNTYRFLRNETLYAVWEELDAPTVTDKVSIRTQGVQGMRFTANASTAATLSDNVEIGFLVTRASFYESQLGSDEDLFTFEIIGNSNKNHASGIAFKKTDGTVTLNKLMQNADDASISAYSAVLIGIPESKANFTEKIYIRSYIKFGDLTLYGNVKALSLYEAALAVKNAEGYETTDYVEHIVEVCK